MTEMSDERWPSVGVSFSSTRFYLEEIKLAGFTALFPLKLIAPFTRSLPTICHRYSWESSCKLTEDDIGETPPKPFLRKTPNPKVLFKGVKFIPH